MDNIKVHTVEHRIMGFFPVVKSFIIEDNDLTLIDTGINAGSSKTIIQKLAALGHDLSDVDLCILTHAHRDHIGGLKALKSTGSSFLVAAYDAEADAVEKSTGVEVELRLTDGQQIGGIKVLYLPGHTLGSIALLIGDSLFTGDALNGGGDGLKPPNLMFTKDKEAAMASVRHLEFYDFERVFVSHGKDVLSGGREALNRLIAELG